MVELRIVVAEISEFMKSGMLDLLTVIPIAEIVSWGIPYLKEFNVESDCKPAWKQFWDCFLKTWVNGYDLQDWN